MMWNTPEKISRMPSSTLITTSDPDGRKATITPRIRVARPITKDAFQLCSRQGAASSSVSSTGRSDSMSSASPGRYGARISLLRSWVPHPKRVNLRGLPRERSRILTWSNTIARPRSSARRRCFPLASLPVGPELIERAVLLRQALGAAGGLAAVERFIGTQRGLSRGDRDLVLDWADNSVRGVFEIRPALPAGAPLGAVCALNLVDDLDYLVYGLIADVAGQAGFFSAPLLPLADDDSAWLAAGDEVGYPRADARQVARLAIDLATREPELVFRNQEKATQGWAFIGREREEFVAFFGSDELVLPTLEAEGRVNAYYKMRRDSALAARGRHRAVSDAGETSFVMPEGFFEFDTVGIIYDE